MPPRYQGTPSLSSSLSVLSGNKHRAEQGEGNIAEARGKALGPRVRIGGALGRVSAASVYVPLHSVPLLVPSSNNASSFLKERVE